MPVHRRSLEAGPSLALLDDLTLVVHDITVRYKWISALLSTFPIVIRIFLPNPLSERPGDSFILPSGYLGGLGRPH